MENNIRSTALIHRLAQAPAVFRALVEPLPLDDLRFVPKHGAWSIAEILGHLADEETEDFRLRLKLTLDDPTAAWPGIDPEGTVKARRYAERDPGEALERFSRERDASVAWLRSLRDPDWSRCHHHPRLGPIAAGQLLASWAAHDALHIRQIAKRLHELAARDGGEHSIDYAGEWRA